MTFFDYLKNIFFILIVLQIAPSLIQSISKQYKQYLIPRTKVAIIDMRGVLYNSNYYNKYLNKYFKDKEIKAILIKMECAGGASGTSQAIFNEINFLKKEYPNKPIITLVENICASGGYYIACATDAIISSPSALIGSIGTTLPYLFQLKDFMEQYKIQYTTVASGKYKTSTDPFVNITSEDKQMLQNVTDDSYAQFVEDVAKKRKQVTINNKEKWAEGMIFTGKQALSLGLIDKIGSAHNALDEIKERALIKKEEEIEWVRHIQPTGFWSIFSKNADEDDSSSMFLSFIKRLYSAFQTGQLLQQTM